MINFEKIGLDLFIIEVKVENGLDSNGNSKGIFVLKNKYFKYLKFG